jgi:plastocyanin
MAQPKPDTPSSTVKIAVAVIIGLVVIGFSLFFIVGRGQGLATNARGGFLGTRGTTFADINLVAEIILLAGLTLGYGFARRGNIAAHQYNQTLWVLFNIVLTTFIMIVSFTQQVAPGIPERLLRARYATSFIHSVLGGVTILCGIYLLLRMNRLLPKPLRVSWWKNLMRVTLGLYWVVGLFGLGTYYVWYVRPLDPADVPETTSADTTPEPGGKVALRVPMANYAYVPPDLTIPLGATVIFSNADPDPHTVTFDNDEFPGIGFEEGDVHEIVFDQLGTFQYYCEFHGSPGLKDMAGVIRVVEPGQVAALPTEAPIPTQTPAPTAAPVQAEQLGPIGFGDFRDSAAHNDEFQLLVANLEPAASGSEIVAWLSGAGGALRLGALTPDANGRADLSYVDPQGANLLADFSGFVVSVEAAGSTPTVPSAQVLVGGSIPTGALPAARQLLVASDQTPESVALTIGLIHQAEELFRHAKAVHNAALAGDAGSLNRHGEHVVVVADGKDGPNFFDLSGDGFAEIVGDGFGLLRYADAIAAQAQAAASAPDATDNVKFQAAALTTLAGNVRAWSKAALDAAVEAHRAATAADQKAATQLALDFATQLLNGVDANGNGEIEAIEGEGGAYTLYFYSQYLAAMGALEQQSFVSATSEAATAIAAPTDTPLPGATDTPAPTATPEPSPTPAGPPVVVYRNFEIVPGEIRIKVGTTVVFSIRGSLHQPYNFTAPNVFEAPPDLGDGATTSFTFNEAGTTTILCGYHAGMKGTVIVEP